VLARRALTLDQRDLQPERAEQLDQRDHGGRHRHEAEVGRRQDARQDQHADQADAAVEQADGDHPRAAARERTPEASRHVERRREAMAIACVASAACSGRGAQRRGEAGGLLRPELVAETSRR
jgi:hypothetical protein